MSYQVIKPIGQENEAAKNRLIFEDFILEHSNPKVGEITRDRLNKYLKAVGESNGLEGIGNDFSKLEEYLEMPFVASVKIESNEGYTPRNKVSNYKSR